MACRSRFLECRGGGYGRKWLHKGIYSLYCAKQPLVFATRPSIINKGFIVNLFQKIVDQAVHDSVTNRSHCNFPSFVVADDKFSVTAVAIQTRVQILKKFKEIFFKRILKSVHFIASSLTFSELTPASPNIF